MTSTTSTISIISNNGIELRMRNMYVLPTLRTHFCKLLIVSLVIFCHIPASRCLQFIDVTKKYGLPIEPRRKYGGACITDLDNDGLPDIIQSHHGDCCVTIHFNNGKNKNFSKARFKLRGDIHSVVRFQPTPLHKSRIYLSISVGGYNGQIPSKPNILEVYPNRKVRYISQSEKGNLFPDSIRGRGRTVVYTKVRRKNNGRLGAVIFNLRGNLKTDPKYHHRIVEWGGKKFNQPKSLLSLGELGINKNEFGSVTDIDGDGVMEILTFEEMRIFNLTDDLNFMDISRNADIPKDFIAPTIYNLKGVSAISEVDFNNDGKWDLYLARSSAGVLNWILQISEKYKTIEDVLLVNEDNRKYKTIKMPSVLSGSNRGVTSGDFNNDGYIDLYVSCKTEKHDFLLLNNNGKSFTIKKLKRFYNGPGDMATAFDYNSDGYLDLLVSTGAWSAIDGERGTFYLLENTGNNIFQNYLKIKVLNSPENKVTNLHAVAKVKLKGRNGIMMRRVGGSNGAGTSASHLNILHFGMGDWTSTDWILVQWSNGERQWFTNVKSKTTITAGI